jgi:hypothetical protein
MSSQWLRFEGVDGKVYTVHEGAVLYCVSGEATTRVYLVSGAWFEARGGGAVLERMLAGTVEIEGA